MRNASQDSALGELRETAQLGEKIRRNEDLIFPLELSEDVTTHPDRHSRAQRRARGSKSRHSYKNSQSKGHGKHALDVGSRKSQLRRGLQILRKYHGRALSKNFVHEERRKSVKKARTLTSMSRISKQCSNSKSRGGKSRSPSKDFSQKRRTKGAGSRISTINNTHASYLPHTSMTISDHLLEQKSHKSQKYRSTSQQKKYTCLAGTPKRPRQGGHELRSSKSQASVSARSKSLHSLNKRNQPYSHTMQRSDTKHATQSLSRSCKIQRPSPYQPKAQARHAKASNKPQL